LVFTGIIGNKLFLSSEPTIDNSVGIWFNSTDPDLIIYKQYNQTFGEKEWSILVLQSDSIYDPYFLSDLNQVTLKISELKNVVKVTSITNVRDNFLTNDGSLDYRRLYSEQILNDSNALKQFQNQLKRNPIFLRNLILKNDDTSTALLIQNDNFINDVSEYRINLVDSITAILKEHPSIKNHALAGTTVVNAELNRASKRDVFVFYLLITVLLTIIALYILKSLRNLVVMYSVVATSSIPAMGMLAAMNIPYNMITVMLPTILIALSVAGVVHIIVEFHISRFGQSSEFAIRDTLRRLFKPTIWTTVTTIAGFSSFATSNVFPVFQLGLFTAFGLLLAGLASLIIAPILLLMLWPDRIKSPEYFKKPNSINRAHNLTVFRYGILLFGLIILVPILSLPGLEVDTNYIKFFSKSHPTSQSYDLIKKVGFAQNPIVLQLKYSDNQPYSASKQIKRTLAFEAALKELPEVIKILSASSFLEEINKAFNEKEAQRLDHYNKAQIEQLLLLGELSGNDDLKDSMLKLWS
jgi:predicted RND superfamily exporter protein